MVERFKQDSKEANNKLLLEIFHVNVFISFTGLRIPVKRLQNQSSML